MSPKSVMLERAGPEQNASTRRHQEATATVAVFLEGAHCRPVHPTIWQIVAPDKQAAS